MIHTIVGYQLIVHQVHMLMQLMRYVLFAILVALSVHPLISTPAQLASLLVTSSSIIPARMYAQMVTSIMIHSNLAHHVIPSVLLVRVHPIRIVHHVLAYQSMSSISHVLQIVQLECMRIMYQHHNSVPSARMDALTVPQMNQDLAQSVRIITSS
jgi:hypothetical protein